MKTNNYNSIKILNYKLVNQKLLTNFQPILNLKISIIIVMIAKQIIVNKVKLIKVLLFKMENNISLTNKANLKVFMNKTRVSNIIYNQLLQKL